MSKYISLGNRDKIIDGLESQIYSIQEQLGHKQGILSQPWLNKLMDTKNKTSDYRLVYYGKSFEDILIKVGSMEIHRSWNIEAAKQFIDKCFKIAVVFAILNGLVYFFMELNK